VGSVESGLWESTTTTTTTTAAAAVRTVRDQRVAGSLLQHVQPDVEPARLRSGVSLFIFVYLMKS